MNIKINKKAPQELMRSYGTHLAEKEGFEPSLRLPVLLP